MLMWSLAIFASLGHIRIICKCLNISVLNLHDIRSLENTHTQPFVQCLALYRLLSLKGDMSDLLISYLSAIY